MDRSEAWVFCVMALNDLSVDADFKFRTRSAAGRYDTTTVFNDVAVASRVVVVADGVVAVVAVAVFVVVAGVSSEDNLAGAAKNLLR